jgi:Ca-activated chloride channel family protein
VQVETSSADDALYSPRRTRARHYLAEAEAGDEALAAVVTVAAAPARKQLAPLDDAPADDGLDDYDGDSEDTPAEAPGNTESYTDYGVRSFVVTDVDNTSTFSIDVDTGSYTIARRKLREGRLPPTAAVRVEEFVNFFRQDYPAPTEGDFSVSSEATASPFRQGKTILRIGVQGRRVDDAQRKRANLVFLVDVSGSMRSSDKLRLVKQSLAVLARSLRSDDLVSICTYAGKVSLVLAPTPASSQGLILAAIRDLEASGSTGMASGIDLAYELAARQAEKGTSTRVIVCSDGDANVGPRSHQQILAMIDSRRKQGIFLSTVGFGMGNYKDTMMEQLADKGDGIYAYVDTLDEAQRLFCEELTSSLEVIARDVKLQVVFDPARVRRYRLIGYENRAIRDRDFRNDAVDAGEIGAGHTVTAVYELELEPGSEGPLGHLNLRAKPAERGPGPDLAREQVFSLTAAVASSFAHGSQRFRFTACVAEFAEVLRNSPHATTNLDALQDWLEGARSTDDERDGEFLGLVRRAAALVALRGA